jgi:hypothetical protein
MSTQKFYIIDSHNEDSDGIIKDREKNEIGRAWNQLAPEGTFINCSLNGYWIISEEDYKLLKQVKKENLCLTKN